MIFTSLRIVFLVRRSFNRERFFYDLFCTFEINITYMKRLYLLLLLLPFFALGQISNGQEAEFDYGIRNLDPQTVSNPNYLGTLGSDGTMGQIGVNDFLNGRAAQSDTGVLDFGGLTTNSSTTINIGYVDGYVVNNESVPGLSSFTHVSYPGASNVTVTTVGTGVASYVMLSSTGVISFQNTFPTSAERKAKIWLGKVSHPLGAITLVVNEPDYITSPLAFSRDWAQDLGPYVNNGVYPYANGANLNINITGGTITGDGIGFVTNKTDPNHLTMGAAIVASFTYRTQTGAGGATIAVTPAVYDLAGTVTAIPGSTNQATIQYFYVLPGIGYVAQLGQTIYPTFSAAVAALGKETFVRYPSFVGNVLPVAALIVTKGCTALNDTGVTAQFFRANKNGDFFGASSGTSTATIQSAYNNSVQPVVTTNSTLGAFTFKRGSAADTDNIIVGQNGVGTNTFTVTGNGALTANGITLSRGAGNLSTNTVAGDGGAGSALTTGLNHSFFGYAAGSLASTADNSSAFGYEALKVHTAPTGITSIGRRSFVNLTTGTLNTAIGTDAGRFFGSTSPLTSSTASVFVGYNARASADGNANENVFGYNAIGFGSNSVTLGNDLVTKTVMRGNIGVNYATPTSKLSFGDTSYSGNGTVDNIAIYESGNNKYGFSINNGGFLDISANQGSGFGGIRFFAGTDNASPTERFRVSVGGKILINKTSDDGVNHLQVNGGIAATSITTSVNTIKITTAVSITTATTGTNSLTQDNRHVIIDNGVNPINITCNGVITASYGKVGTGAITFVQGSGRTLVQLSGTAVLNGAVGSTATLWSNGTTDYLAITNY